MKNGDRPAVRTILRRATDVNEPSADGTTALHWAVHRDDADMVDLLISAGADVKRTNRYGVAPLSLAAQNGNATVMERLGYLSRARSSCGIWRWSATRSNCWHAMRKVGWS